MSSATIRTNGVWPRSRRAAQARRRACRKRYGSRGEALRAGSGEGRWPAAAASSSGGSDTTETTGGDRSNLFAATAGSGGGCGRLRAMAESDPAAGPSLPAVHPDVVCRRMGDATVLVHLGTDRIHTLNRTGTRLFELLRAGADRREIHRQVREEYEIDPPELDRELDRLLAELHRIGVLVDSDD